MRHGSHPDGALVRRCRLPELPRSYAGDSEPIQRLLAFAYLQAQKTHREAAEELRKDADTLSAILAAQGRMASDHLDLPQALAFLAEGARRLTGAGGAAIALREGQRVVCRGRSGLIAPDLGASLNRESGVCGECLVSGEVQLCDDTEHDPRVDIWVCRSLGMRSILAVPLRRQEEVLGIIVVFSGWAGVFSERDIRALKLLAGLALEALWAHEAHQRSAVAPEPVESLEAEAPSPDSISAAMAEFRDAIAATIVPDSPAPEEVAEPSAAEIRAAATELPLPSFAVLGDSQPRRLWRTLAVVAAALAIFAGSSEVVLWHGTHVREALHLNASAAPRIATAASAASSAETSATGMSAEPGQQAAAEVAPALVAGPSQLLSIRSWSKPESTTLALFLQAPARWESGTLKDPERIYFDLENTQLAGDMVGKSREGLAIQVDDGLVRRVRVGAREGSALRVVIDLAAPAEYSAVLSPAEPYRLMIVIRGTEIPSAPLTTAEPALPAKTPAVGMRQAAPRGVLSHPRIVIDPGHGGSELGAVGHEGLKEKDLTLEISKRLGVLLASRLGAEVIYTRTSDQTVPLEARAEIANQAAADLFVSIHANSSDDPGARGVETYYVARTATPMSVSLSGAAQGSAGRMIDEAHKLDESHKLAVDVQESLYRAYGGEKGVLNRGVKQAPFVVLLDVDMPSILAEVAFVTSPADERRLSSSEGQDSVAEALYRGIAHYVSTPKREKVVASMGVSTGQ